MVGAFSRRLVLPRLRMCRMAFPSVDRMVFPGLQAETVGYMGVLGGAGKRRVLFMKLVLVRHGESIWNKENLFTGWTDVDLSETGF